MESWSFTEEELLLKWERPKDSAFDMQPFQLTEYTVDRDDVELNETSSSYDMYTPVPRGKYNFRGSSFNSRKVTGNYSTLIIKFRLTRHVIDFSVSTSDHD